MDQLVALPPCLCDDETAALRLSGDATLRLLQGQLTQDISKLEDGQTCWSFVLKPRGQVVTLVQVARIGDEYLLVTEKSACEALLQHLKPHLALSRVAVLQQDTPWRITEVAVGESLFGSPAADLLHSGRNGVLQHPEGATLLCDQVLGVPSLAVFGASLPAGCSARRAQVDAFRILRGEPRFGIDLFENTLPAESGIEARTVSYTKGCYCGQEVVAKQHWIGKPRQRLVHFRFTEPVARGDIQVIGTHSVVLTSVAHEHGIHHALGLVPAAELGTLPAGAELVAATLPVNSL